MRVCLVTDKPDHPLLAGLGGLLGTRHSIEVLDPDARPTPVAKLADNGGLADVYLLKSRSARALTLARFLEELGARVVNDSAATQACQDRLRMAQQVRKAGLLFPDTYSFARLSGLVAYLGATSSLRFPLVVKSRRSRRHDLVTSVGSSAQLAALAADWAWEPVVVQPLVPNDGLDRKFWVIGNEVFTAIRPTVLDGMSPVTIPKPPAGDVPADWIELLERVGKVFGLDVYGVDILPTARGPVIVDVNAFPGCRGVPGAPEALAALVRRVTSGRAAPGGAFAGREPEAVPLAAFHRAVRDLLAAFDITALDRDEPSTDGAGSVTVPRVIGVRRKPGRGLVATYRLVPAGAGRQAGAFGQVVTASLAEGVLTSPDLPRMLAAAEPADFHGSWPGILSCSRLGMTLQCFPADDGLPSLAATLTPEPGSPLADALATACRSVTGEDDVVVRSVRTVPVRYKPGTRCVIRYDVRVALPGAVPTERELVFFAKVHRDAADAASACHVAEGLWNASAPAPGAARRFIPRPLALVEELNLALGEAAGGAENRVWASGTAVLRPPKRLGPPGCVLGAVEEALVATGTALASWHASDVRAGLSQRRCGDRYATKIMGWTSVLAGQSPTLADELARVGDSLAEELRAAAVKRAVLVHGAFKPSQLVFCGTGYPVVTDFDGACLGDPALDVGCFLAYLRPAELWRGRGGAREWFALARRTFLDGYLHAMRAHGASRARLRGIEHRASLFEAAHLFKISSRRARRLSSPRPTEVAAVLAEVKECLRRFEDAKGTPK